MLEVILIAAINSALGLTVLFRNVKEKVNIAFFTLAVSASAWSISSYLTDHAAVSTRLFWARLAFLFPVIATYCLVYIALNFPTKRSHYSLIKWTAIISTVFAALLSLTDYVVENVQPAGQLTNLETGVGYVAYVAIVLSMMVVAIYFFAIKRSELSARERSQSAWLSLGLVLSFIWAAFFSLLLPVFVSDWSSARIGPLGTVFFIAFTAYSIIKHRLFDIRLIVARSAAYILLLATLSALYATVLFGVSSLFLGGNSYTGTEQALNIVAAIVLAFTFQPLKRFFDRITNSIFYRDAYNSEAVIRQVNDVVLGSLALDGLLFGVSRTLKEELRVKYVAAQIKQVENVAQTSVTTNGASFSKADMNFIHESLGRFEKRIIVADELESGKLKNTLRRYDIDLIARIVTDPGGSDDGLGFIALGPKRSGTLYTNKDITLLDLIASELVVAVQNSLRFEEISQFNEQLTARVDSATSELRDKNKKLKKLDHAKDDFISMASHQLRTPLTTIKGYLSMLSDGDLGELDEKQQQVVESAFASSERMVYLISDLLNASRINTGKFVIDKEPVKLKSVIENEIKQLRLTAEARDIKLTAELGDKDPVVNLDANKLKQVIMNFIDNAIYYSEQGSEIIVNYQVTADAIELRVKDSGIGVPNEAQSNLFTKFYRAENAKRVRPDGTGLGLFLAKKVVTAQGGSIIFESEIGKGSTFGFRFALSAVAINEEPAD